MRTQIRKFIWTEDDDRGEGWLQNTTPDFIPLIGFGVAHDCLEHMHRHDTSIEGELKAFGVMLWGRGQSNWWVRQYPRTKNPRFWQNAYSELGAFLNEAHYEVEECHKQPAIDHCAEQEELSPLYEKMIEVVMSTDYEFVCKPLVHVDDAARVMKRAMPWIRRGWHEAERNYNNCGQFDDMFTQIMDAPPCHEFGGDLGEKMIIRIDYDRGRVDITAGPRYDRCTY